MRRIYLDYAASAPEIGVSRRAYARAAKLPGNPSSIHKDGVSAARLLAEARGAIASVLHAHPDEIVMCASGTESDNMAVMGVFKHARLNPDFAGKGVHIITTAIEHPAILEACEHLEAVGAEVTYLNVDHEGIVNLKELRAALRPETVLVSVGYANSEIGTIQPIREIAKEIRHFKKQITGADPKTIPYPLLHTDACQAAAYLNLNIEQLGVDLLSLNGTKLGGPRGSAILFVRRGTPIAPLMYGGGQEAGLRSGTENLPGAAGLAAALAHAEKIKDNESARLTAIRDFAFAEIAQRFPDARINGSKTTRLPNTISVSFPETQSELLVLELDARGIAASAGSACAGHKDESSHVLDALYGKNDAAGWGTVRLSFGHHTKMSHIKRTLAALDTVRRKYAAWK